MCALPEVIVDDAQMRRIYLDPVVSRTDLLALLAPLIPLSCLVPDNNAGVSAAEQRLTNGRRCPALRPPLLRTWRRDPVRVQRLRDGLHALAVCAHLEDAHDDGGLLGDDLPFDVRSAAVGTEHIDI